MSGLEDKGLLARARAAGVPRVFVVYLAASWGVLQAVDIFTEQFGLPTWFFPAAVALLLIGLPIIPRAAAFFSHAYLNNEIIILSTKRVIQE